MMKVLVFLFWFGCLSVQAQVNGVVVDEQNHPITYANVWNMDASAGATTKEDGSFKVEKATAKDEFVISAAGYETLFTPAVEGDTIKMKLTYKKAEGLVVYPEKTLHHTIGNAHYENLYFNPGNIPWIYVRYFENTPEIKQVQYIDKAIVYTRSIVNNATFKLRILKPDANGCPGEDLLMEPIIVSVKRGNKKNMIELLAYNIKLPKEGVFVGVEWLLTENNRLKTQTYVKGELLFEDFRYAPDLISNRVEKSTAYRYMFGDWISNDQFLKEEERVGDKPFIDPSIGLILSN